MVYMTRHNDRMTATEDLTAWLRAQLDDDERACTIIVRGPRKLGKALAAHILRDIEAKRRIMAIHHPRPYGSIYPAVCDGCGYAGSCDDPVTEDINDCPELRILAAVYADRPGYRDEWRP